MIRVIAHRRIGQDWGKLERQAEGIVGVWNGKEGIVLWCVHQLHAHTSSTDRHILGWYPRLEHKAAVVSAWCEMASMIKMELPCKGDSDFLPAASASTLVVGSSLIVLDCVSVSVVCTIRSCKARTCDARIICDDATSF